MSRMSLQDQGTIPESAHDELVELKERIRAQAPSIRNELEPLVDDALEHARFRRRAMMLARDALQQFRLDMAMLEFDLEATRREREVLRSRLGS